MENREKLKNAIDELLEVNEKQKEIYENIIKEQKVKTSAAAEKWVEFSDRYYEFLGNNNDWRYLMKRSFYLWWLNVKINLYSFFRNLSVFE